MMIDKSDGLPVVFLVGPTAIGKSRVAIQVAKTLGTEILTADSTQVYRGMDIGTDKPTPAERDGVPHRLIDLVEPDEPFNVGLYRRLALQEIARLHTEGRVPLVVGGTGLYVRALAYGLWEGPPADWGLRLRRTRGFKERRRPPGIGRLIKGPGRGGGGRPGFGGGPPATLRNASSRGSGAIPPSRG